MNNNKEHSKDIKELILKTETQLSIEKHIDNIKTNINKLIDKHNT